MHHVISFLLRIAYAAAFGFILLCHTEEIVTYIPQLLGGLLMLESVAQLLELLLLKTRTKVNYGFFLAPGMVLLYGLFLIFCCSFTVDLNNLMHEFGELVRLKIELKLGGACFIIFILSEIVISAVFFKPLYMPAKFAEERRKQQELERMMAEREKAEAIAATNRAVGNQGAAQAAETVAKE